MFKTRFVSVKKFVFLAVKFGDEKIFFRLVGDRGQIALIRCNEQQGIFEQNSGMRFIRVSDSLSMRDKDAEKIKQISSAYGDVIHHLLAVQHTQAFKGVGVLKLEYTFYAQQLVEVELAQSVFFGLVKRFRVSLSPALYVVLSAKDLKDEFRELPIP